jgi:hypothetical protein
LQASGGSNGRIPVVGSSLALRSIEDNAYCTDKASFQIFCHDKILTNSFIQNLKKELCLQ